MSDHKHCSDAVARTGVVEMRKDLRDTADEARAAKSLAENLTWKLNVVLAGVAATFTLLVCLVGWTVTRLDGIEDRSRTTAALLARDVARDECARLAQR